MKANAPEKIYIQKKNSYSNILEYHKEWTPIPLISEDNIEYTRTDAFIEKVARFLEYKLNNRVEIRVPGTLIPSLTDKETFIEDVKEYMK